MRCGAVFGTVALLAGGPSLGESPPEQPTLYQVDEPGKLGRPKRIVAPKYPVEALEKKRTGFVDVEGRISPLLDLKEIAYRPDSPESAVFVESLKQVVPHWEFHPLYGRDCFPSDERIGVRVWFELDEGQPKISVTVLAAEGLVSPDTPQIATLHRVDPQYPSEALRNGLQAFVWVQSDIKPDGSVEKVTARAYPPRSAFSNSPFEREATRSMSKWKYSPLPEGETTRRRGCHQLLFTIKG
jgi:TonB family protein